MIWENMELTHPRTFRDEGRKTTHDFLSLYSPAHQDPSPSQGSYLKTHDFLQPLEGARKNLEVSAVERPPNPHPSVTHILPGGIGTYSISYYEKRAPKQEGSVSTVAQASSTERNDENSNCSSYSGSGFTLWEESASTKGKTGKENIVVEEIVVKKEAPNFEGKSADQMPSTPRSKHSATEQRRRCKINDRFHKLREILPHGDQKRDKASFLLEVIEYIQHLQEKVHRYEARTNSSGVVFDMNKPAPQQLQAHFQPRLCANSGGEISDQKLKEQEQQSIERGRIGISSVYSQQLLNSLTQALQHSGVDLSQASVAVQIDVGKRAKRGIHPSISSSNDMMYPQDDISMSNKAGTRSLTTQTREESDQALQKRFKTSRS